MLQGAYRSGCTRRWGETVVFETNPVSEYEHWSCSTINRPPAPSPTSRLTSAIYIDWMHGPSSATSAKTARELPGEHLKAVKFGSSATFGIDANAPASLAFHQLAPIRHSTDSEIGRARNFGHDALAFKDADKVIGQESLPVLPSAPNQIAKIDCTFVGSRGPDDLRGTIEGLRWASFVYSASARVMDQANIHGAFRPDSRGIALPIDRELTWPELVWQQIDVAQYVDQHV